MTSGKTYAKMDPEVKAKWIADLRANPDKQGYLALQTKDGKNCCLGRLALLQGIPFESRKLFGYLETVFEFENYETSSTTSVPIGFCDLGADAIIWLQKRNDDGWSFNKIADWIEKHL